MEGFKLTINGKEIEGVKSFDYEQRVYVSMGKDGSFLVKTSDNLDVEYGVEKETMKEVLMAAGVSPHYGLSSHPISFSKPVDCLIKCSDKDLKEVLSQFTRKEWEA